TDPMVWIIFRSRFSRGLWNYGSDLPPRTRISGKPGGSPDVSRCRPNRRRQAPPCALFPGPLVPAALLGHFSRAGRPAREARRGYRRNDRYLSLREEISRDELFTACRPSRHPVSVGREPDSDRQFF